MYSIRSEVCKQKDNVIFGPNMQKQNEKEKRNAHEKKQRHTER